MNLKSNKGYVGIDASIAVLVLLILIPTITGMIYNVNKTNNLIDRKTEALSIAINTIETAKGLGLEALGKENVIQDLKDDLYSELDIEEENVTLIKNENTYKIEIDIQDYADTEEGKAQSAIEGVSKIINVKVIFKSGKEQKNIELSTVIS